MAALVTTVALFDGKGKASLKVRNSSSCFASSTSFLCCSSKSAGASGNSSPSPSFLGLPFFGFSSPLASSASSGSALPSTSIIGASSSSTSSGCFIFSVPAGTAHTKAPQRKYLEVEESTSFPFFKGPAVSKDKTPGVGHLTRRWGRHC